MSASIPEPPAPASSSAAAGQGNQQPQPPDSSPGGDPISHGSLDPKPGGPRAPRPSGRRVSPILSDPFGGSGPSPTPAPRARDSGPAAPPAPEAPGPAAPDPSKPPPGSKPLVLKRYEAFAQLVAAGNRGTDSYKQVINANAKPKSAAAAAAALKAKPHVRDRIIYLRSCGGNTAAGVARNVIADPSWTPANVTPRMAQLIMDRAELLDILARTARADAGSVSIAAAKEYASLAGIGPVERDIGALTPEHAALYAAQAREHLQERLRERQSVMIEVVSAHVCVRRVIPLTLLRDGMKALVNEAAPGTFEVLPEPPETHADSPQTGADTTIYGSFEGDSAAPKSENPQTTQ